MSRTLRTNAETFWWTRPGSHSPAFNEDADDRPAQVNLSLSSTLDTRAIDPFRQGVEITTWRHWAQGTVKIHSGDVAHGSTAENYGLCDLSLRGDTLLDTDQANPVTFIGASAGFEHRSSYLIPSLPPRRLDRGRAVALLLDGVLDAVDVRDANMCFGGDMPFDNRGVSGFVGPGNVDAAGRSDLITSFIEPPTSGSVPAFKDDPTYYGLRWPTANKARPTTAMLSPFTDRRLYAGEEESPTDVQIAAIVGVTSGSDDAFPPGVRASTNGWVYDDGIGTDSIAFGGLTY